MAIELKNIEYKYNPDTVYEKVALQGININIQDGEFIGLIGHTGSGKSTLVQHLNGLLKPTSGEYRYNGKDVFSKGYSLLKLRSKVGIVFQYPEHQLFETSVLEDVKFGPKNLGLDEDEIEKRAKTALFQVGVEESLWNQSPFELSGGQKRRVAIAGVLAMEPEVLVLDEPTAGLDPKGRYEILDQIKKLHEKNNITVVLVSHSMEDVAEYVNRIIVMNHGQVVMDGAPKEVFKKCKELEEIGLGIPSVTYVMNSLKQKGIIESNVPITIAEAKKEILDWAKGRSK